MYIYIYTYISYQGRHHRILRPFVAVEVVPSPSSKLASPWNHSSCPFGLGYLLYRGTALTRKCNTLGPHRRPMPRVLGGS